jgi:hypothetical protein
MTEYNEDRRKMEEAQQEIAIARQQYDRIFNSQPNRPMILTPEAEDNGRTDARNRIFGGNGLHI